MEQEIAAIQNLTQTLTTFGVTYGFQMVGAIIIIVAGLFVSRWVGRLSKRYAPHANLISLSAGFLPTLRKLWC